MNLYYNLIICQSCFPKHNTNLIQTYSKPTILQIYSKIFILILKSTIYTIKNIFSDSYMYKWNYLSLTLTIS